MKVLHLITGGDTGGAKTHVLTLLKELNNYIDSRLLCIMEGIFTEEAKKLDIPIKIVPQRKRYNIFVIKKMANIINEGDYDILHCHGARANFLAVLLRPLINTPIITTVHSDYKLDFSDNIYKYWLYTPINSLALRFIKYYIAVTHSFKDMLVDRGFDEDKIFEVYNGISFKKDIEVKNKEDFLKEYNIKYDENKLYIGNVGRLHPVKGIDIFLKASKELLKQYDNIVFLVAGEGEERKKYEEFIKTENLTNDVYLLGHVTDMNSFYNVIDINILSSYTESFPYALLEGARQKKATISSRVGGISRMIDNGENGFLFESGSVKDLVNKSKILIEDEKLRNEFGEKFYTKVKKEFSGEAMAKAHVEIYKKLLEKEGSR